MRQVSWEDTKQIESCAALSYHRDWFGRQRMRSFFEKATFKKVPNSICDGAYREIKGTHSKESRWGYKGVAFRKKRKQCQVVI